MKKLIAIATLGLALGLPSLSFASDSYNAFGVQLPIVKSEARNEIKGGDVEKDLMSFYLSPKEPNRAPSLLRANQKSENDDKDYIIVFGVRIPVGSET